MSVSITHIRELAEEPVAASMKGPLIGSVAFHIFIVVLSVVTIPFVTKEPIVIAPPVTVELVDIKDISQAKPSKPVEAKPKPSPSFLEPPDIPEPAPPKIKETPKEPEKPVPPPEPVKKEPEKKVEPKTKEKKPAPKEKPKEKPKEDENALDSLLKDLTKPEENEKSVDQILDSLEENDSAGHAPSMSISELDALRRQIEPCWNVQAGAKYAENLAVQVRIRLNRDGSLINASVLDKGRYNRDAAFRAAADSAMRAVRNPRCSPLKLPPAKYDEWKNIVINFDPKDML